MTQEKLQGHDKRLERITKRRRVVRTTFLLKFQYDTTVRGLNVRLCPSACGVPTAARWARATTDRNYRATGDDVIICAAVIIIIIWLLPSVSRGVFTVPRTCHSSKYSTTTVGIVILNPTAWYKINIILFIYLYIPSPR